MKKSILKTRPKGTAGKTAVISTLLLIGMTMPVYAASGFDSAVSAINVLKGGFLAIVGGIGIIITIKNIMDIGSALNQRDMSTVKDSLGGLAGGIIMAGVSGLLAAFGLS